MAPHKCNYLVFSNGTENESEKLELKLNGIKLKFENNPTFLGIRFDNHLTFKNQIDYLKKTCVQRLNILKIISYKTWKLSTKTLMQVCLNKIGARIFSDLTPSHISNETKLSSSNTEQRIKNNLKKTYHDENIHC